MKTGLHKVKSNTPGLGSLFIIYQGSAKTEYEGHRGLHHLAEHLQCHAYEHLEDELQSAGIVSNAYTADDHVAYFWSGLDRKIEQYQKQLLELTKYIPTREQFEMEKMIVLQEYKDYISGQEFLYSNIQRKYFNYFGPIGYSKDIEEIDFESFLDFYLRAFQRPTSIIRIGESETIEEDTKSFQYMPIKPNVEIVYNPNGTNQFVEANSSFPDTMTVNDWVNTNGEISYKNLSILSRLWSYGLPSPLYQELREKRGLVYGLGMYVSSFEKDSGLVVFSANCSPDKIEELRTVLNDTFENESLHITKERFDVVIENMKCEIEMKAILNYNNVDKFVSFDWEYMDLEYLNNLTFEEIKEDSVKFANLFKNSHKASHSTEAIL